MKLQASGLSLDLTPIGTADAEGWARVRVALQVTGIRGEFEGWLQVSDLTQFERQLSFMYSHPGTSCLAELSGAEPDICLKLAMQRLGQISGKYAFESERRDGEPTCLSGSFELDQSYLPQLRSEVLALVAKLKAKRAP